METLQKKENVYIYKTIYVCVFLCVCVVCECMCVYVCMCEYLGVSVFVWARVRRTYVCVCGCVWVSVCVSGRVCVYIIRVWSYMHYSGELCFKKNNPGTSYDMRDHHEDIWVWPWPACHEVISSPCQYSLEVRGRMPWITVTYYVIRIQFTENILRNGRVVALNWTKH